MIDDQEKRENARRAGRKYYAKNRDAERERNRRYHAANRERIKERARAYLAAHPERVGAAQRKWDAANPEKRAAMHREWTDRNRDHVRRVLLAYRAAKPERAAARAAARRARQGMATPAWADRRALLKFYLDAAKTGMTVDHIVPLKHSLVCGLHVPWNLQLISASENCKKSNRFVP